MPDSPTCPRRRRSAVLAAACTLPALCCVLPAHSQPGPGDPLPEISLKAEELTGGSNQKTGALRMEATGNVLLEYGDLKIRADRLNWERATQNIEAIGNVTVRRGDETLTGERFVFRGAEGTISSDKAVIISPPYFLSAREIQPRTDGSVLKDIYLTPSPDGKGEISVSAEEIRLSRDGKSTALQNATIRLFGTRIMTVRHLRLRGGPGLGQQEGGMTIPLTLRASRISGIAVGARMPLFFGERTEGIAGFELTQRTPIQPYFQLHHTIIPETNIGSEWERRAGMPLLGGIGSADRKGISPLRQLAIARPLPARRDPILDFDSILSRQDPLAYPLRTLSRRVDLYGSLSGNRETAGKRQGPLLVSRLPEVEISGSWPLVGAPPEDASNSQLRSFLRRPHLQLSAALQTGQYQEKRLKEPKETVSGGRSGANITIGLVPILVGDHLLLRADLSENFSRYSSADYRNYQFLESRISAGWIFSERTVLSGSYIRRDIDGASPFHFDAVDTRNELQVRGQTVLPGSRFTVASLLRFDMSDRKLFDTEIAVAWRGKAIEPRISYRTQNSQIGFTIALPGLIP